MTRRDYCANCSEIVSDYAVCCHHCNVSICNQCVIGYDALSNLSILYATIRSHYKYNMTIKELDTLHKSLTSTDVQNIFIEYNMDYNKDVCEKLPEYINTFAKIVESYENIVNKNTLITNKDNAVIMHFIDECEMEYNFKCYVCHGKES